MQQLRCVFLLFGLVFSIVSAQDQEIEQETPQLDNVKVGFVNIRSLLTQAPQIAQIQEQLADKFEEENKAVLALRRELSQLNAEYDQKSDSEALTSLQTDIADKQLTLAKLQQNLRDAYSLKRNEALGKLQTLIVKTVADVSKEQQLDIVLNNTGVIYINSRIDITPIVFKRLSKQSIQ